jgi:glycosyl transferase family 2
MSPSPQPPATNRHRHPSPSVSIVIPVSDAAGLCLSLRGLPAVDEVVVVTGETGAEALGFIRAACPGALLVHPTRAGIGNALACGFAASGGDIVVALNADGSTDPGELPRYVRALLDGADVALGSRYRDGGRDLTGGRFRRWAGWLLIRLVNALFGVRRTDPGFGYAAFWRDAIDRLDLPDPSGHATTWGDGPEYAALLTVRTAARNLVVAEVGSVAYPRIRRAAGADRTTLRHWARAIATEYAQRNRTARHSAGSPRPAGFSIGRAGLGVARPAAIRSVATEPGTETRGWPPGAEPPRRRPSPQPRAGRPTLEQPPNDRTSLDRRAGHASRRARPDAKPDGAGWMTGYPSLRRRDIRPRTSLDRRPDPTTGEIRAAARPAATPAGGPTAIGSAFAPSAGEALRPPGPGPGEHREVGTRRRRLEGFRQEPNLRVINGEGGGTPRGRGGRLRAVPRENPAG